MGNLYYEALYKNKIINLLLRNKNLIKLINPAPSECDDLDIIEVLLGGEWNINGKRYKEQGHIFDYDFVKDTITEEKTFIFVETDIDTIRDNMLVDFNLYVCIFTSKELVRLSSQTSPTVDEVKKMGCFASTYANRIDVLCDVVDRILNGSDKIPGIGDVKPAPRGYVTRYCPNRKYYGKCLKYKISNLSMGDSCEN
jgi:hypothetical protein